MNANVLKEFLLQNVKHAALELATFKSHQLLKYKLSSSTLLAVWFLGFAGVQAIKIPIEINTLTSRSNF
jgi:hypothetical protein